MVAGGAGIVTDFDIDLQSTGDAWQGTFNIVIETAIADITMEGPLSPVEITVDNETYEGTLSRRDGAGTFFIDDMAFRTDVVTRFRA